MEPFPAGMDVGGGDDVRRLIRPLPQQREVDSDKLADTAQRVLDLVVDLDRGQVDDLEERSEMSVSNSRSPRRSSAEPGGSSSVDIVESIATSDGVGKERGPRTAGLAA
jgi:hypothetical protein